MGLFDKYREYQESRRVKRIARAGELIANPKAIKEDRLEAIHFLAHLEGSVEGVPHLLKRFDYSLEHGIADTKEKELALKGIENAGQGAVEAVTKHLSQSNRIAWPIKALHLIADDKTILQSLKSALDFGDTSFNQNAIDKNYDILCYLRDYSLTEDDLKEFGRFLKDSDERVRFAAAECVLAQGNEAMAQQLLEGFFHDTTVENSRIHQAVTAGFADNGWKLKDPAALEGQPLFDGYRLGKNGEVERIG